MMNAKLPTKPPGPIDRRPEPQRYRVTIEGPAFEATRHYDADTSVVESDDQILATLLARTIEMISEELCRPEYVLAEVVAYLFVYGGPLVKSAEEPGDGYATAFIDAALEVVAARKRKDEAPEMRDEESG